jgi:hypothetical protein
VFPYRRRPAILPSEMDFVRATWMGYTVKLASIAAGASHMVPILAPAAAALVTSLLVYNVLRPKSEQQAKPANLWPKLA